MRNRKETLFGREGLIKENKEEPMAGEETDAGLNLIKYLSVEKGDIVSCPTFRRSNPSPSLSVSYLLASFCSAPFFRTRTDPWSRVREPRVYKGEARRYGVYVCSMISRLVHVRQKRRVSKRGKTSMPRETDSRITQFMTRERGSNDVSVFPWV